VFHPLGRKITNVHVRGALLPGYFPSALPGCSNPGLLDRNVCRDDVGLPRAIDSPASAPYFLISMEMELPADSRRVLNMILDNGSIRGFELRRMSGMPCDALIKAAKPLIDNRYVTASGVLNEDTLDGVRFAPLSSSLGAR
jgi:hypothetical protein